MLEDDDYNFDELQKNLRGNLLRWNRNTVALPIGQPQYALLGNREMLEEYQIEMPQTWEEFNQLLDELAATNRLGEDVELFRQPGGSGSFAENLILRAAAYVVTPGRYSTYFDVESMEPLIDSAPFQRALDELVASSSYSRFGGNKDNFATFTAGKTLFALTIPMNSSVEDSDQTGFVEQLPISVAKVPVSKFRYDYSRSTWISREELAPIYYSGFHGFLAGIDANTENKVMAQEFLVWLGSKRTLNSISSVAPQLGTARSSQIAMIDQWVGEQLDNEAITEYSSVVENATNASLAIEWVQLKSSGDYISALDRAIESAINGDVDSASALSNCKKQWQQITDGIGRDQQKSSYRAGTGF